jgi:hypothetical protein
VWESVPVVRSTTKRREEECIANEDKLQCSYGKREWKVCTYIAIYKCLKSYSCIKVVTVAVYQGTRSSCMDMVKIMKPSKACRQPRAAAKTRLTPFHPWNSLSGGFYSRS